MDTPDVVAATLLEGLSDKKPKVPPACVGILIKALELFGARAMPLKDLKAALPGICCGLGNVERIRRFRYGIRSVYVAQAWFDVTNFVLCHGLSGKHRVLHVLLITPNLCMRT